MALKITNPTEQVAVLNRWADGIESQIRAAHKSIGHINTQISPFAAGSTLSSFGNISDGTNISATMIVGSGATLKYTETGILNSNKIGGIDVAGNVPTSSGQILVSQSGNLTALWTDKLGLAHGGTNADLSATGGTSFFLKQSSVGAAITVSAFSASDITSAQVALARGGTNADLSATGGTSQVLRQSSSGAAITVSQLSASDLSNGTTGSGAIVLAGTPSFTNKIIIFSGNSTYDAPAQVAINDTTYTNVSATAATYSMALVRDNDNGGTALVLTDNAASSLTIVSSAGTGTTFVTSGTPAATEVDLVLTSSLITAKGGSSRNGAHIQVIQILK